VARADSRQQQRRDGDDDQPTTASRRRIGLMRSIAIFIDEIESQGRSRARQGRSIEGELQNRGAGGERDRQQERHKSGH
jgi:hypothetical protein